MFAHREQKEDAIIRLPTAALVATESLRRPGPQAFSEAPPGRAEEKIPIFWRVFGGTVLSIAALACMTVYQQFNNGINDLRKELNAERETRADLVKKDEVSNRLSQVWTGIKDASAANTEITAIKERCAILQEQLKAADNDRKAQCSELQLLRERLSRLEGQIAPKAPTKGP